MFAKGFKTSKCKTLVKLAMSRIKLLRNKRSIQVRQLHRDISELLRTGHEPSARIRVEHVIREQNILDAYDMIEIFCELVVVRLPIIEATKQCPNDLKEAISSLIFVAPRCADLPELLDIRDQFSMKYGKEFVAAAAELRPDCGVNRRIIEKLSVRTPSGEAKLNVLKQIAAEFNLDWDHADSEAELLKQPEDLIAGPGHFLRGSEIAYCRSDEQEVKRESSISPRKPSMPFHVPAVKNEHVDVPDGLSDSWQFRNAPNGNSPHDTPTYKDVKSAAKAAAEAAEQAAEAAQAAAILAQRECRHLAQDARRHKILKEYLQETSSEEESESDNEQGYKNVDCRNLKESYQFKEHDNHYEDASNRGLYYTFQKDKRQGKSLNNKQVKNGTESSRADSRMPGDVELHDDLMARFQALKATQYS